MERLKGYIPKDASTFKANTTVVEVQQPAVGRINPIFSAPPPTEHVTLGMFAPDALKTGKLDNITKEFFGARSGWLAAYANEDSERITAREQRKKERFLAVHPEITPEEYDEMRKERVKDHKRHARRAVNQHFTQTVGKKFAGEYIDIKAFTDVQLASAAESMRDVENTLYPANGIVRQRNEVGLPPISPAKIVEKVSSINVDTVRRREETLKHLVSFPSAELARRNKKFEADRRLAQIQDLLNQQLYEAPEGSTDRVTVRAIYDNKTTEVKFIEGIDGSIDETALKDTEHIKEYELAMRKIRGTDIQVYTNPDIKGHAEVKAIRKTQEIAEKGGDDVVRTEEYVHDTHRMLFAVLGGPDELQMVIEKIDSILSNPDNQQYLAQLDDADEPIKDDEGQYAGRVVDIFEDSETNGYDSQSKQVKFTRLQVVFSDLPVPMEIKGQDMKHFLMDEFHVGTLDQETGFYSGAAHVLYKYKRAKKVRQYFIAERERAKQIDLDSEAAKTQEKIVADLQKEVRKVK